MAEFITHSEWLQEVARITGNPQVQGGNTEQFVSRVAACVLLANSLPPLNTGIAGSQLPPYRDIDSLNGEEKDAVRLLYHTGIMFGYSDMSFKPNQRLSSKESREISERALQRVQAHKTPVPYEVVDDASTVPVDPVQGIQPEPSPGVAVVQGNEATFAILTAAERPTAGYRIVPESVVQGKGRIELLVRLEAPSPDQMVAQMITYPQLILKFAPTTQPIVVLNPESLQ